MSSLYSSITILAAQLSRLPDNNVDLDVIEEYRKELYEIDANIERWIPIWT